MAWYDDPNNTQGAAAPGSSSVPPGPPQVPGGQPQMPPPVQPQTPPGPPQGLGGPPQMGPPQGVHGDLPTSGGGNNNNKLLLVIAAVAVAAVVTIGGGIGAFMLLSGPEELSMSSYADKMCDEVIEPNREELVSLVESRRYEKRLFDRDIDNEDEAQEAIDLATENLDFREQLNSAIGSFNLNPPIGFLTEGGECCSGLVGPSGWCCVCWSGCWGAWDQGVRGDVLVVSAWCSVCAAPSHGPGVSG